MQKPTSSAGLLILLELGAEWPSAVQAELSSVPGGARRVFAQEESELPAAFAARVGAQLDGLFARGASLGSAVIACNERLDDGARGARAELGRAAAGAMARGTGGRLLLTVADRNQGRSRTALVALESELRAEWQSAAVELALHFANDAAGAPAQLAEAEPKAEAQARRARGSSKDRARRVA
jgi:hypothetical protein